MAERLMIACDNPQCKSIGTPEHIPGEYGKKKRGEKVVGPYGWHQGEGWLIGCGPAYTYVACSDLCVGPAILARAAQEREKENGDG